MAMLIIGLTGSIGMGKSTTGQMLRQAGLAVHDSDATVHELYSSSAVPLIEAEFPGTALEGRIDRNRLAEHVLGNPAALCRLESMIHPLVAESRNRFLRQHAARGDRIAVLDIPLLFETGCAAEVDLILVVTAASGAQEQRVLSRPGMTPARFQQILQKQMPDAQKRLQAHAIVWTDQGLSAARQQIDGLLRACAGMWGRRVDA